VSALAVDICLRWGDQILRVERWTGHEPLPEGLDLALDARGRPCLGGAPLEAGLAIDVALGDGLAPYRSDLRTALVARVELVELRRHAARHPRWRSLVALAGALAIHALFALSAFAHPKLAPDDAPHGRDFEVTFPVRVLYAPPTDDYGALRERANDESACLDAWWGCGASDPRLQPLAAVGLPHATRGCLVARKIHVVGEGETLTSIAATYALRDFRVLYNEALNEAFVRLRPDPNRIFPGDALNVPGEGLCAE
jgi:hypothetical protein